MDVRGVQVEASPAAAAGAGTEAAGEASVGGAGDESSVRRAHAAAIAAAAARGAASVALQPLGLEAGMPAPIAARIAVQEAIRAARAGGTSLRRIVLCCPRQDAWPAWERTVNGYLRHLLDVLIWGPMVTVDALIEVPGGVVVIRRTNPPLGFALPGGFVDYGESLEDAVRREAREETGLELRDLRQLHTYSDPARDPRFHTVTTVFAARADGTPRAGDDAADAMVVPVDRLGSLPYAFDHGAIIRDWLAARPSR